MNNSQHHQPEGLYRPEFEHDSCGIGFVANLKGRTSHDIIENALTMLTCMEHRGGTGFDIRSGDGAGVLIQIPHRFFAAEVTSLGFDLPEPGPNGGGMIFFPNEPETASACREMFNTNLTTLGLELLGYRPVPRDNSDLGQAALKSEPIIEQAFVQRPNDLSQQEFERKLFVLRKYTTHRINREVTKRRDSCYFASLSSRTIVYKGQLTTSQVRKYYLDLQNDRVESTLAMFHSRFSTNTFPAWRRAQPFRYLSHNGEINTVKGNVNWMRAREALFESVNFTKEELSMLLPVCNRSNSDSANLDAMVELLTLSGRSLPHVMMMLVPEAWQDNKTMDKKKKAFYVLKKRCVLGGS